MARRWSPTGCASNSLRGTPRRLDREQLIDACTEIVASRDRRGNTVLRRLRCEVPLVVRTVAAPASVLELALVNGAAGPLGGDRLRLRLCVEPAAAVAVRSIAASMAQPGPRREPSMFEIDVTVAADAALTWRPQPTVSVAGSDHRVRVDLDAHATATVTMHEGVILGRHREPPGRFALRERVKIDGVAVLDHETVLAPGSLLGPGGHGPGRYLHTEIVIGDVLPDPSVIVSPTCQTSTVHLTPRCALAVVRGVDGPAGRA